MKRTLIATLSTSLALATTAPGAALALTRAQTAGGLAYATGGVSIGELRTLAATKDDYDLWVTTAAKGSGAFLSDVKVVIRDEDSRQVMLDTTMTGPWLFIELPPGSYAIEAHFKDQALRHVTRIEPGVHHQALLYFDSAAAVSPDWKSPFAESPYATG
jgi:hypothetical protein